MNRDKNIFDAFKECDCENIQAMLNNGADVNLKNRNGTTLLAHAAYWGCKETVQILLAAGADVNIQDKYGMTPLNRAKLHKHANKEIIAMLEAVENAQQVKAVKNILIKMAIIGGVVALSFGALAIKTCSHTVQAVKPAPQNQHG